MNAAQFLVGGLSILALLWFLGPRDNYSRFAVFAVIANFAIWGAIIFVAQHFIVKYW